MLRAERKLALCADVAEFCPTSPWQDVMAVGTYELDEVGSRRKGILYLFQVIDGGVGKPWSLKDLCSIDLAGIFDLQWLPPGSIDGGRPRLAAALADGSVVVYKTRGVDGEWTADQLHRSEFETGEMVLAVDALAQESKGGITIAACGSRGTLKLFQLAEDRMHLQRSWQAHDLECWTCALHPRQDEFLYSGADDSKLKVWDTRQEEACLAFCDRKTHGAGVCCIAFHPVDDHVVCTGSYDEQLRLWDARVPTKPVCQTSLCLGGGVWRAKWCPHQPNLIACAAMHNGFAVVEHEPTSAELSCLTTYQGHKSLAYGVDWCRLDSSSCVPASIVASCSFYDKLLHVWTLEGNG